MKKYFIFLFVMILSCAFLASCSFNVTGKMNLQNNIKNEDVNSILSYNKISNATNKIYLESVFGPEDAIEHYLSVALPEELLIIEKQLKKDLKVCYICEQKGILVNREVAQKKAEGEYNLLKTDRSQELYYKALKTVLANHKISENTYLELLSQQAYYKYNFLALKDDFKNNQYDKNSKKSFDEQFTNYLNDNLK